jgi:hypothetical protein
METVLMLFMCAARVLRVCLAVGGGCFLARDCRRRRRENHQ